MTRSANPLKTDPSRTRPLLNRFLRNPIAFNRPRAKLNVKLLEWVGKRLDPHSLGSILNSLEVSDQVLKEFEEYLLSLYKDVYDRSEVQQAWRQFIQDGYEKGAARSYDDVMSNEAAQEELNGKLAFYEGTRAGFLKSAFSQPVSEDRLKALVSRTFSELQGFQSDERNSLRRILADGLTKGDNPKTVARELSKKLDIDRSRLETIARTELSRAHAEGQLTTLEKLGVDELDVEVEWTISGNACPRCVAASRKYASVSIEKSHGLIPHHPNCRCCWIPRLPKSLFKQPTPRGK